MIAIPAVDLRDGVCVQLVGGSYARERVRLADPVAVARDWHRRGFSRLHVVDLDAATGKGANDNVVSDILRESAAEVQVGGGVRSTERLETLVGQGATWVITGTRALADQRWLEEIAAVHPGRIVVAVDVKHGRPVARGWTESVALSLRDVVGQLERVPLAGLLVTAVDVEGQERGPDLALVDEVLSMTSHPLLAAGGITTIEDLRALERRGVSGAVIGMALYTGSLDAARAAEEYGE
jgi:phosphoribosylformimino-5-aminoimidazole carboxamide ribotide isomerase